MAAAVEVAEVSMRFGSLLVLEELSFELAEGEALGIIGPNGAGKTTALNVIAGDLRPSSGHVRLKGHDVTRVPAHVRSRAGLGRTSQIPRPFEGLTVFENVLVGASFVGHRRRRDDPPEAAAVAALERTGLLARANRPAGSLTLLERKRLELARALATHPDVLLLDEIAGGLTEGEVHQLVDLIRDIHADGVSLVWIEHIVHALVSVVDRLLAMDYGRVLTHGDPREVLASEEVQAVYLGTDPEASVAPASPGEPAR